MAEQIELPDRPITYSDGRPVQWFSVLLRKLSATVDGILQFIDLDSGVIVTADQVQQGITQRVREIVNEELEYNAEGIVERITRRNIETGEVVGVEDFTYMPDGGVETITETTAEAKVVETINYDGQEIADIAREISIGGLF